MSASAAADGVAAEPAPQDGDASRCGLGSNTGHKHSAILASDLAMYHLLWKKSGVSLSGCGNQSSALQQLDQECLHA